MKKKGIVLEVGGEMVTILTPDGEFIQVLKEQPYQIGEEIEKVPIQRQKVKRSFFRLPAFRVAAAGIAAACILAFAFVVNFTSKGVYAYVSIDINPSIELAVDDDLEVIDVKGYNKDGKNIVNLLPNWREKEFTEVTEQIIELSMKNNYLQHGGEVLITAVEREADPPLSKQLNEELDEVKKSYQTKEVVVTTRKGTIDIRNKAEEKGVSTGKYLRMIEQKRVKKKESRNKETKQPVGQEREIEKEQKENSVPQKQEDKKRQENNQERENKQKQDNKQGENREKMKQESHHKQEKQQQKERDAEKKSYSPPKHKYESKLDDRERTEQKIAEKQEKKQQKKEIEHQDESLKGESNSRKNDGGETSEKQDTKKEKKED